MLSTSKNVKDEDDAESLQTNRNFFVVVWSVVDSTQGILTSKSNKPTFQLFIDILYFLYFADLFAVCFTLHRRNRCLH